LKLLLGVTGDGGKVVTPIVGVRGKVAVDGIVWRDQALEELPLFELLELEAG
jgi:membrane protein implicated in regulation of membrane protease activity